MKPPGSLQCPLLPHMANLQFGNLNAFTFNVIFSSLHFYPNVQFLVTTRGFIVGARLFNINTCERTAYVKSLDLKKLTGEGGGIIIPPSLKYRFDFKGHGVQCLMDGELSK
ncbi:hypothetical protein OUZ56_028679 [Daphnia magna]|uniref:Uncharacterized protein n=1 Tax=Daphnia magna TaxID=35525 RepID=A0ABR0B4K8_9CRUS|nr:hypothetical protein OUZ56_028679 [Daphnia magna]